MGKYDDIININYTSLKNHPRMSLYARAAQFAPFAALTGYNDGISETARYTDSKSEIDECVKDELNRKLMIINSRINEKPEISITYFTPDKIRPGGKYETVTGYIKNIDLLKKSIIMHSDKEIYIDDIFEIEGEIFNKYE